MHKVKLNNVISFLIAISMLFFAFRGKLGAIVITVYIVILLCILLKKRKIEKNSLNISYVSYIFIFAVLLQIFRTLSGEYYLIVGYIAAGLLCINGNLKIYDSLWKYLKMISLFEASGVYLQRIFPDIYYVIMSIILPSPVINSIKSRLISGYYTGFSREVSYTMFFIVIGLGTYIFDAKGKNNLLVKKNKNKLIAVIFLLGALVISGKRATLIFFVIACFITQFLRSDDKIKVIKYLYIGLVGIFVMWITFPLWSKISFMRRIAELIGYIVTNDMSGITNGRIAIYNYAIQLWNQHKLIGIGWGNFKYSTMSTSWFYRFDVHNCYLQLLCENGILGSIPGYLLICIFLCNSIRCAIKLKRTNSYYYRLSILMVYIQIFFTFYCITEPIFFEYPDYIIYFVSVNIIGIITKTVSGKELNISHGKMKREKNNITGKW